MGFILSVEVLELDAQLEAEYGKFCIQELNSIVQTKCEDD